MHLESLPTQPAAKKAGKLPRHPAPQPTESLFSYAIRLSEINGFDSPWKLLKRAEIKQHEWRSRGVRPEHLAPLIGWQSQYLEELSYCADRSSRSYVLLGKEVSVTDIVPDHPKLCIQCVQEKRFVEAHWDLAIMVGCPIHAQWACSACKSCGRQLGLYRPGLLRCACGAALKIVEETSVDRATRELLEVTRLRLYGLLPFADFGANLPIAGLHGLELKTLLRIIEVFGECRRIESGASESNASIRELVVGAADALSAWPHNFHRMLHGVAQRNTCDGQDGNILQYFRPFYAAVFKAKITAMPETLNFIEEAFLDYVTNHWMQKRIDRRTLKGSYRNVERSLVGVSEMATSLHIDPRTVKRHAAQAMGTTKFRGKMVPLFASLQRVSTSKPRREIMSERIAAKKTGLSVSVLRSLKRSGDFQVNHQMQAQLGYRSEDVDAFMDRLIRVAALGNCDEANAIDFRSVVRSAHYSMEEKIYIIRLILDGALPAYRASGESTSNILLLRQSVNDIIRAIRTREDGPVVDALRARTLIGCGAEILSELIRGRFVIGSRRAARWDIVEQSLVAFREEYAPVAEVASNLSTSPRRIIQLAKDAQLDVLLIKANETKSQYFVSVKDMGTLEDLVEHPLTTSVVVQELSNDR